MQKVIAGNFTIEHINGDLHKLTPILAFQGIDRENSQSIRFVNDCWRLFRLDLTPAHTGELIVM